MRPRSREQAAELLEVRLWGIGTKTPNRLSLSTGDFVLIYVGAPEYSFIGHGELGSSTHEWTPEQAARYPGDFEGGVSFTQADVWSHPVPMKSVLPQLALKESNPGAHFFSGVVRVTKADYEKVVAFGIGKATLSESIESVRDVSTSGARQESGPRDGERPIDLGLLFKTVEKLKPAAEFGGSLSEYDTRARVHRQVPRGARIYGAR